MGSIRRKTHEALPRYTANSEHTIGAMDNSSRKVQNVSAHSRLRTHKAADSEFSGAMEDMPGKVQNANTHILQPQNHEHAHSSRSVQGSSMARWMKCLGKGRRRAHMIRGVRIHIGVGQRCRARDVESPTLPAKRTSAFQVQGGDG